MIKTISHEKTNYSVLACYTDERKLPLMVIFNRKTLTKDELPSDCDDLKPAMLVCDSFEAHQLTTESTQKRLKVMNLEITVIPVGLRSNSPSMSLSINHFKHFTRDDWNKWIANNDVISTERMKRPTI